MQLAYAETNSRRMHVSLGAHTPHCSEYRARTAQITAIFYATPYFSFNQDSTGKFTEFLLEFD